MKLLDYRKKLRLTRREASAQLGVTESTLFRWERGRVPRAEDMRKIRNWSDGAVTADDMIGAGGVKT